MVCHLVAFLSALVLLNRAHKKSGIVCVSYGSGLVRSSYLNGPAWESDTVYNEASLSLSLLYNPVRFLRWLTFWTRARQHWRGVFVVSRTVTQKTQRRGASIEYAESMVNLGKPVWRCSANCQREVSHQLFCSTKLQLYPCRFLRKKKLLGWRKIRPSPRFEPGTKVFLSRCGFSPNWANQGASNWQRDSEVIEKYQSERVYLSRSLLYRALNT